METNILTSIFQRTQKDFMEQNVLSLFFLIIHKWYNNEKAYTNVVVPSSFYITISPQESIGL